MMMVPIMMMSTYGFLDAPITMHFGWVFESIPPDFLVICFLFLFRPQWCVIVSTHIRWRNVYLWLFSPLFVCLFCFTSCAWPNLTLTMQGNFKVGVLKPRVSLIYFIKIFVIVAWLVFVFRYLCFFNFVCFFVFLQLQLFTTRAPLDPPPPMGREGWPIFNIPIAEASVRSTSFLTMFLASSFEFTSMFFD
jgi:hypothetical protein